MIQKRFCYAKAVLNLTLWLDFKNNGFVDDYHVLLPSWLTVGLLSHAIVLLDETNTIHTEQECKTTTELNYEAGDTLVQ